VKSKNSAEGQRADPNKKEEGWVGEADGRRQQRDGVSSIIERFHFQSSAKKGERSLKG